MPPVPSILIANVQSLDNKVDEIRERIAFQRDIRGCNILCFTETWVSRDMLLESVQPPGFWCVCFMINISWCNSNNIQELKSFCSPVLEFLTIKCRPYYLPREFSLVIVTAVYIPPQTDTTMVLKELHWTLC
jgi:hypothetical protein